MRTLIFWTLSLAILLGAAVYQHFELRNQATIRGTAQRTEAVEANYRSALRQLALANLVSQEGSAFSTEAQKGFAASQKKLIDRNVDLSGWNNLVTHLPNTENLDAWFARLEIVEKRRANQYLHRQNATAREIDASNSWLTVISVGMLISLFGAFASMRPMPKTRNFSNEQTELGLLDLEAFLPEATSRFRSFDSERVLEQNGQNRELFGQAVRLADQKIPEFVHRIEGAQVDRDSSVMRDAADGLKRVVQNFQATCAHRIAAQVEMAATRDDFENSRALIPILRAEVELLQDELGAFANEEAEEEGLLA